MYLEKIAFATVANILPRHPEKEKKKKMIKVC
jgi:hypothetical protein